MFRESIGEALKRLTRETFGSDADKWRAWWRTEGRERFVDGKGVK